MPGVVAEISLSIDATLTGSNDLGNPKQRVPVNETIQLLAGTNAVNKADLLFSDTRTIAASGNEDLDLAGVLASAFGATIAAAEIVLLYIKAADANTNNVVVGPAASAGALGPFGDASDRLSIRPGEFLPLISQTGWAVTATSADKINVSNSGAGTGVTYDILIIGRSVAA